MASQIIYTPECAPPAPFMSQAIRVGNTVYTSGQLARNADGVIQGVGDMATQTRQALENTRLILAAAGAEMRHVVKMNTYLLDMSLAPEAWAVRLEIFGEHPPACTGVQVGRLTVPEAMIEIEVVAVIDD